MYVGVKILFFLNEHHMIKIINFANYFRVITVLNCFEIDQGLGLKLVSDEN